MAGQHGSDTDMLNIQHGPKVINLNTYIQLAGFIIMILGGAAVGGVLFSEIRTGLSSHAGRLDFLDARVAKLENDTRVLDTFAIRLERVEKQADGTAAGVRNVESSINQVTSDIRLVKEILMRLESSRGDANSPLK